MLTTLRTGSLTLSSIQYKFDNNNFLTIKITASSAHKLYGDIKITLANVDTFNITRKDKKVYNDYLNNTFLFSRTGATTLEYKEQILNGITKSDSFITLPNNGSAITATIANSFVDLAVGTYNFALLDTVDSEFSTSNIAIKQLNLANTSINGVESVFDELGEGDYLSINGQDLTFDFIARVSINNDVTGTTNIPILITNNYGRR